MKAHRASSFCVAIVLLVYLYARLQHGGFREEESREAEMVRLGSKVVASDLLKRGRLWRDATAGGGRARENHNSLTNRPHWFLDSLLLLAGDIELNPGPAALDKLLASLPDDTTIDVADLRFVVKALNGVEQHWNRIGQELYISDLQKIRHYYGSGSQRLIVMVDSLLRGRISTDPGREATWKIIICALYYSDQPLFAKELAFELSELQKFSPLPIARSVDDSPLLDDCPREAQIRNAVAAVHSALTSVASRWFEICAILGLPLNSLTTIRNDSSAPEDIDKLRKGLRKWLDFAEVWELEPPSWQVVVDAMAHGAGGNNPGDARKLAKRHKKPGGGGTDKKPGGGGTAIKSEDLDELVPLLDSIAPYWDSLMRELGVADTQIEKIRENNASLRPDGHCRHYLIAGLKVLPRPVTYGYIASVLEGKAFGNEPLASKIRELNQDNEVLKANEAEDFVDKHLLPIVQNWEVFLNRLDLPRAKMRQLPGCDMFAKKCLEEGLADWMTKDEQPTLEKLKRTLECGLITANPALLDKVEAFIKKRLQEQPSGNGVEGQSDVFRQPTPAEEEEYESSGDESERITDDMGWPWRGEKIHYQPYKRGASKTKTITLQEQNGDLTTINPNTDYQQPSGGNFYPMERFPHGIALIISNKNFALPQHSTREGAEKDVKNLRKTFRYLGYEVIIQRDCTSTEIEAFFKPEGLVFQKAKEKHNSFVCCMLSHGRINTIIGTDSNGANFISIQHNLSRCNMLLNKPKLFFINGGFLYNGSGVLPEPDYFISTSMSNGGISTHHMDYGSHYVLDLCQALISESHNSTLLTMHQTMHRRVGDYTAGNISPSSVDMLAKHVYFFEDVLEDSEPTNLLKLEQRFKAAMEKGHVKAHISTVFLHGPAGSGKTCFRHVLAGEKPPDVRNSTAIAARPTQIFRFEVSNGQWRKLTPEQRTEVLVQATQSHAVVPGDKTTVKTAEQTQHDTEESTSLSEATPPQVENQVEDQVENQPENSSDVEDSDGESHNIEQPTEPSIPLPDLNTASKLANLIEKYPVDSLSLRLDMMDIIDTGGQPQFHELLRYFVKRRASLFIFVFKLSETLDNRPLIDYYEGDTCLSGTQCATQTTGQILQQCMCAVRSVKHDGQSFKILFLGTYKDKQNDCPQEVKPKNQVLKELISGLENNVCYYKVKVSSDEDSSDEIIYPINASELGDEQADIVKKVCFVLTKDRSSHDIVDIPLQWYGLEILLEELSENLERRVIHKEECLAAAKKLHFTKTDLEAALDHLDKHCLIFYYRGILPDIIFSDVQVLLDKIMELFQDKVAHNFTEDHICSNQCREFLRYSKVTLKFLSQERFKVHYVSTPEHPDFFTAKELILLFRKLSVFADLNEEKGEYFIPALLESFSSDDLQKEREKCSAEISPLVLLFPDGGLQLGVFCCLVTYLLSPDNVFPSPWSIKKDKKDDVPQCLKRNCITFSVPKAPGCSVTLVDSFQSLEVHVKLPGKIAKPCRCAAICSKIHPAVFNGLFFASEKLEYTHTVPDLGFACPHQEGVFHYAVLGYDNTCWVCSEDEDQCDELATNQLVWLKNPSTVVMPHQIDQLAALLNPVAAHWDLFIGQLGVNKDIQEQISGDNNNKPLFTQCCLRDALDRWFKSNDKPTYKQIAEVLRGPVVTDKPLADKVELVLF